MPHGRVANGVVGGRLHAIHDGLDELPGREVLAGPLGRFLGTLGEQPLVDVALHVGLHRRPLLGSMRSTISRRKRGGVLDLGPGLLEDFAEHPWLLAEFFQEVAVMGLEFVAVQLQQALPAELRRHDGRAVVRRLGQLVGHLEKEQKGDLLRVGHVREAVVPQDVGEVPGFADDLLAVVAHGRAFFISCPGRCRGCRAVCGGGFPARVG